MVLSGEFVERSAALKELIENIFNKTTNKSILIYNDSQFYKIFFQLMESVRNHKMVRSA